MDGLPHKFGAGGIHQLAIVSAAVQIAQGEGKVAPRNIGPNPMSPGKDIPVTRQKSMPYSYLWLGAIGLSRPR
ncbi:hypothetical protein GCM10009087_13060 [Sphingomonas oligophenolica]